MKVVVCLYLVSLLPFAVAGVYRLWMLVRFRMLGDDGRHAREVAAGSDASLPVVTVQLPLYNERYVAARLLRAVARLDYPHDRLEIQVLDDSDDATSAVVARTIAGLPETLGVHHVRRVHREGYKAGALAAGLAGARGELVAVFDADFVPHPDYLRRVVGHFREPDVGMVQTRWSFLDDGYSVLTEAQAALLNAHFGIEHPVRWGSGRFFNFNGTAGIWRRAAIESAGGWRFTSLTEDLDLSYRAQLAGWRFVYRGDVEVPSEIPTDVRGFRTQQYRWSRGMTEVARALLPSVWRAALPLRVKLDATFHLLSNVGYLFVCAMSLTLVPTFYVYGPTLSAEPLFPALSALVAVTNFGVIALFLFAADASVTGRPVRALGRTCALLPVGVAIAITGASGLLRGLAGRPSVFVRTPKHDVVGRRPPRGGGYPQPASRTSLIEAAFALYHLVWVVVILRSGRLDLLPLSAIFVVGYTYFVWSESAGVRTRLRRRVGANRNRTVHGCPDGG